MPSYLNLTMTIMHNILLVFTGGTIASSINEHTINTDAQNASKLINLYQQNYGRAAQIHFQCVTPIEILSENLNPEVWLKIFAAIDAVDLSKLDGIIVTHGTDTLAFSAAILSLYYAQLKIPLVLVSSNYPLTDTCANGLDNFNTALEFILTRKEAGVFVAYRNPNQAPQIHLGSRLLSCLPLSDQFISLQSKAYLEYDGTEFKVLNPVTTTAVAHPTLPRPVQLTTRILLIKPYPGLNYSQFNLQQVDVVLHDLYHSGTACASDIWGNNYNLAHFVLHCQNCAVPVYLAPASYAPDCYISTKVLLAQGAKILWNISLETAYTKLLLAYSNFKDAQSRQNFLEQNIANEQLEITLK